jgi:hypothetical protein
MSLLLLLSLNGRSIPLNRVAEPPHYNADPDPDLSFHFIAAPDPDPTFHFNADSDNAPHQSDASLRLRHWSTDPLGLHFDPVCLHCKNSRHGTAPEF